MATETERVWPKRGDNFSTQYQPESRMKWDHGWDKWFPDFPPFDDADEAEEFVREKHGRMRANPANAEVEVEYRIVKVIREFEREVRVV